MHRNFRGFTLIELMIVVAAIAILAAIALPSFNEQVRKSRRSEALSEVGQTQLALERWRADNPTYAGVGATGHPIAASTWTNDHYTFTFGSPDATTYTLTAAPRGGHVGDRCGNLSAGPMQKPTWATADCN